MREGGVVVAEGDRGAAGVALWRDRDLGRDRISEADRRGAARRRRLKLLEEGGDGCVIEQASQHTSARQLSSNSEPS